MSDLKPSAADILVAIGKAAAGGWIDPAEEPICWFCVLFDDTGNYAGDGEGHTAAEAMAFAWLCRWAPDALHTGRVEPGSVPFDVPPGWRFELTPPWCSRLPPPWNDRFSTGSNGASGD